ncbi:MAG: hypothetical protein EPO09_00840 [Aquabacterium sp.]|uniref:COG4315 family predicted lipoprotein n=1 Tax=Aquabacterium sp. TaxID=1872578 RepID=UPI00120F625A|nr:hypothetical protein [Aquabacterium sp.]TAK99631.1 MAG: hypothetical protein EPO09_00840 [Aquabacterium sp.]
MTSVQTFCFSAIRLAFFSLIAFTVKAQPVVQGGVLTDAAGRTLYTFDKDQANKSNCQGGCLQNWPPYVAAPTAGAKPINGVARFEHDDMQHWTWNGSPLYYFIGDAKPGDRNGDGKGGVWHVVKPGASTAPVSTGSSY